MFSLNLQCLTATGIESVFLSLSIHLIDLYSTNVY